MPYRGYWERSEPDSGHLMNRLECQVIQQVLSDLCWKPEPGYPDAQVRVPGHTGGTK